MAKAPTPGKSPTARKEKEEQEQAYERVALRISCEENGVLKEYVLHMDELGPNDDLVARKQTGLPVTPFFQDERFGSDSLLVLYWVARRKSGETNLRFDQILEMFPSMKSIQDAKFNIESLENEVDVDEDGDFLASEES